MDVYDAARTVLSVKEFQDKPVPKGIIRKIVESAWLTASSMNAQPWHFIVVEDRPTLEKLGKAVRTGPYIAQGAFAVVVGFDEASPYGVSDASRAIQSMVLTAWGEGVASRWAGFQNTPEVNNVVGLPKEIKVLAVIPFGYPAKKIGRGKKNRKPFGEVVNLGKYGQAFK